MPMGAFPRALIIPLKQSYSRKTTLRENQTGAFRNRAVLQNANGTQSKMFVLQFRRINSGFFARL
jgi:hypothetical protein